VSDLHVPEIEDILRRAGYGDILISPYLTRLGGVSFLSILDLVYNIEKPTNRYEHSLGVTFLALQLGRQLRLAPEELECFVISNLLHDIGHAPFSHNSEPFLLQQLKVYHQGLGSTYLRYNRDFFPGGSSIGELLSNRQISVRKGVADLLSQKIISDQRDLATLFHCPINCDKIDGNNRTFRLLGRQPFPKEQLLDAFCRVKNGFAVKRGAFSFLTEFWEAEKAVYWERIYTLDVFAAEAMITKSLEMVFDDPEKISKFVLSTDEDAWDLMGRHPLGLELTFRLKKRRFLKPLSVSHPDVFKRFKPEFEASRFQKEERKILEQRVSEVIDSEPDLTISHFSRRKHFRFNPETIYQRTFFDDNPDTVPLDKIEKAFVASKISGDLFDIFHD